MSSNLLSRIKKYFLTRKKIKTIQSLNNELTTLKVTGYKPESTRDITGNDLGGSENLVTLTSESDEYEFQDMYSDPVRAVKILKSLIELKYDCPSQPMTVRQKRIAEKRSEYRKFD